MTPVPEGLLAHLPAAPVALPLVLGAVLVLLETRRSRWTAVVSVAGVVLLTILAALAVARTLDGTVHAYLLGNWPGPYGIPLVLDRLAAGMLALTAWLAAVSLLYALGGDARRGPHFHSLLQFQLMGLNGAFLTGDLFNLFVFFEVLLAASYGLLLHGTDPGHRQRLRATVHYLVFNLVGSALFLVAASLVYSVTGTLQLADLAQRWGHWPPASAPLAQAAALLLLVVFALKAALLPLYAWLPPAYGSAVAPVAALFAIMTKVGVYATARLSTLVFANDMPPGAMTTLTVLALATLAAAGAGALAAQRLRVLLAYLVVGSAGLLLLAVSLRSAQALAAGLFYLAHTTVTAGAGFLLADRLAQARGGSDALTPLPGPLSGTRGLGLAFLLLAMAAAGLPPLAGAWGKVAFLQAAVPHPWAPALFATVLGAGLAQVVALARAGSVLFWQGASASGPAPGRPVSLPPPWGCWPHRWALGLAGAAVLGVAAGGGTLLQATQATAAQLQAPGAYLQALNTARAVSLPAPERPGPPGQAMPGGRP